MDRTARLDVFKALGDNTRYAIYLELARSVRPLATADVAEALGLHPNTVRPHLERMRDVGLLVVHADSSGGPGRPQHRYQLAPDAPSLGLEPASHAMLARMLMRVSGLAGAGAEDAAEAGRDQGRADRTHRMEAGDLAVLIARMEELGFDPAAVTDDGAPDDSAFGGDAPGDGAPGDDTTTGLGDDETATTGATDRADTVTADQATTVAFANCPFRDLAEERPDVVCALHRGLCEGLLAEGDLEVAGFGSLVDRDPCRVDVRRRADPDLVAAGG